MRAVCCALGVSRSHVLAMRDRPSEWTDLRKSPPRSDDAVVKKAIANVVKDRATYGYRRVWARLQLEGHDRITRVRQQIPIFPVFAHPTLTKSSTYS